MIKVGSIVKVISSNEYRTLDMIGKVIKIDDSFLSLDPVVLKLLIDNLPIIGYNPYAYAIKVDLNNDDVRLVDPDNFENYMEAMGYKIIDSSVLEKLVNKHTTGTEADND